VANEQMRTQTYEQRLQRHITVGTGIITLLLTVLLVILYHNYRNVSLKNRLLYQRNVELLQANNEKDNMRQKYKSSSLTNTDKESMQQDIISVMENSDEIFQQDFSLTRLATILEADHHHVSQVINEQLNQNFASLLNQYRIIEACRRMNTPEIYGNLTIEGIANGVGFKSRPYFVKVFKELTGLTPSAYLKLAKEQNLTK
jgi:YesN/AraC family two-component response regulator